MAEALSLILGRVVVSVARLLRRGVAEEKATRVKMGTRRSIVEGLECRVEWVACELTLVDTGVRCKAVVYVKCKM